MSEYPARWPDRILASLYWPILVLAWIDAVLAGAGAIGVFPTKLLIWAIVPTAALAAIVFCLMVTDVETRRAMNRVNEMTLVRPRGALGGVRLLDPEWGLFGSRYPDRRILVINRLLLAGFAVLGLLMVVLPGEPLILVFAAYFMTTTTMFPQLKRVDQAERP